MDIVEHEGNASFRGEWFWEKKKGSLDNKAAWINYLRLHGEPSLVHSFLSEQINKGLSKCISDKKSKTDLNNKPNNGYR